jgi:formylglycine-generating enzyme required for sulfatase activity
VSDVGAFDMVGNLWERVADWADFANSCFNEFFAGADDLECFGGPGFPGTTSHPSAMIRGGFFGAYALGGGTHAGVFAVRANVTPDLASRAVGFRCVR